MKFRTAIILPDIHYPAHSKVSIDLVKKFIKDIKPDGSFNLYPINIINNKFIFNNKIYASGKV